ncbi:VanW family protein [Oceanobacillus sp. CAU 1775]
MKFLSNILIILITSSVFPIVSSVDAKQITLQKDEVLHYNIEPIDTAFIDQTRLHTLIESLREQVQIPPVNATFDDLFNIVDGKDGKSLDHYQFKKDFFNIYYDSSKEYMHIPIKNVSPRVDRMLLEELSSKSLGSYATRYNSSNEDRSINIKLATQAINGTVIFPGESFSFNEVVGERTKDRGYKKAQVIVRGEFAEDIGGGICQVSSTLYNAVEQDGIQILERYTHSRDVPYVPPGRDATVSWWGPDFSFKNLYNEPIVIKARASKGNLYIEMLSSDTVGYFKSN